MRNLFKIEIEYNNEKIYTKEGITKKNKNDIKNNRFYTVIVTVI